MRGRAVLLTVLLLGSALGGPVSAHSSTATLSPSSVANTSLPSESLNSSEVNGTVEVMVHTGNGSYDSAISVEEMKAAAEDSNQPVVDFASQTDGVNVVTSFWIQQAVLVRINTTQADLQDLQSLGAVEMVTENFNVSASATRETTNFEYDDAREVTYGVEQIDAEEVWKQWGVKGDNTKIAVLDTGVDLSHPDIELYTENKSDPTYPGGWAEFKNGNRVENSTPHDSQYHGTHVSATVTGGDASGRNIGVAPKAELMHGLVLPGGKGSTANVLAGIQWAVSNNADVVSMSLGIPRQYSDQYITPIQNARSAGTVVVASIGNSGPFITGSPGNLYNVLSVGASDRSGSIADFSSGKNVSKDEFSSPPSDWPKWYIQPDVSAPGTRVLSADASGGYWELSGTSMAAPHVAGAIALMRSYDDSLTVTDVWDSLKTTAWSPDSEPSYYGVSEEYFTNSRGTDIRHGAGIIDVRDAMAKEFGDGMVEGVVKNESGARLQNANVKVSYGGENLTVGGNYGVEGVSGTRTVTADKVGYEEVTKKVSVDQGQITTVNFSLEKTFQVNIAEQPDVAPKGENTTAYLQTEYIESLTTSLHPNSTVDPSKVSVIIDGESYKLGERVQFDEPISTGSLPVLFQVDSDADGVIQPEYTYTRDRSQKTKVGEPMEIRNQISISGVTPKEGGKVTYGEYNDTVDTFREIELPHDQVNATFELTGVTFNDTYIPRSSYSAPSGPGDMDISPDGKYMGVQSQYGTKLLYRSNGTSIMSAGGHIGGHVDFSPNGELFAYTAGSTGIEETALNTIIVDTSTGETVEVVSTSATEDVAPGFSKDGEHLTVLGSNYKVHVFNTTTWEEVTVLTSAYDGTDYSDCTSNSCADIVEMSDFTWDLDVSPEDNRLATTSRANGTIYIYNTSDWSLERTVTSRSGQGSTYQVEYTNDGGHLVTAAIGKAFDGQYSTPGGSLYARPSYFNTTTWSRSALGYTNLYDAEPVGENKMIMSANYGDSQVDLVNLSTGSTVKTVEDTRDIGKFSVAGYEDEMVYHNRYNGIQRYDIEGQVHTKNINFTVDGEPLVQREGIIEDGETVKVHLEELARGEKTIGVKMDEPTGRAKVEWKFTSYNDSRTFVQEVDLGNRTIPVNGKISNEDEIIVPMVYLNDEQRNNLSVETREGRTTEDKVNITFTTERDLQNITVYQNGTEYDYYSVSGSTVDIQDVGNDSTWSAYVDVANSSGSVILPGNGCSGLSCTIQNMSRLMLGLGVVSLLGVLGAGSWLLSQRR